MDFGNLSGGRLADGDGECVTGGIAGDNSIFEVLSDAAVIFAIESCGESAGIIGGFEEEWFVDEAAVYGGVEEANLGGDITGDIDLKFHGCSGGDSGVTGADFVENSDCGHVSLGEGEGAQEADGFGAEDGVETGYEGQGEECGPGADKPAAIDNFVDVYAGEVDSGAFFEDAAYRGGWQASGGLQVDKCGEAAIEAGIIAIEHACGEDRVNLAGEAADDKAVEDEKAAEEYGAEEDGAGEGLETTGDDPVVEESKDEDIADEEECREYGGSHQVGGFDAILGEGELVPNELFGVYELVVLGFWNGGHWWISVKERGTTELR